MKHSVKMINVLSWVASNDPSRSHWAVLIVSPSLLNQFFWFLGNIMNICMFWEANDFTALKLLVMTYVSLFSFSALCITSYRDASKGSPVTVTFISSRMFSVTVFVIIIAVRNWNEYFNIYCTDNDAVKINNKAQGSKFGPLGSHRGRRFLVSINIIRSKGIQFQNEMEINLSAVVLQSWEKSGEMW